MTETTSQRLRRLVLMLQGAVTRRPHILPLAALGAAVFVGAALFYGAGKGPEPKPVVEGPVPIGGPFRLIGPDGSVVTEHSFPGKWTLVFFGYTFCPDVCPTTMIEIAKALNALGPRADQIQPLFITVDPARDTPQILKDYTAHFDPRIIGLTGSADAIERALDAYKVYAAARPAEKDGPVFYDHSAIIYLMSPSGLYATHFTAGIAGEDMAAGIAKALDGQ